MEPATTMHALIVDDFQIATFRAVEIPRPEPTSDQVLVRIKASGVNPIDSKIRTGKAPHAQPVLPAVLGTDLAGVVEAVGTDVTAFKIGDEVYGLTGGVGGLQGSLAEFAAVDPDLLTKKPTNFSMREAAALPLIFLTAWEGLVDRANVRADQQVLILGGSGVSVMLLCKLLRRVVPKYSQLPRLLNTIWCNNSGLYRSTIAVHRSSRSCRRLRTVTALIWSTTRLAALLWTMHFGL